MMPSSSLDLSLPEGPRRRAKPGILQWLTLAAAVATLAAVLLERKGGAPDALRSAPADPERLKTLATDLEKRTLYLQAGEVWGEYLAAADLSPEERGRTLYRRARCLLEAGRPAEAARALSESEGYSLPREERRRGAQLLLECLQTLGKEDAYDSVSRAFAVAGEEEKGTAVARVGKETITREEVREGLKMQLEEALKLQGAALTPAEAEAKAADLADAELEDAEGAKRAIGQAVSSRLLYREGLERGFGSDEATAKAVARIRRELVGRRVLDATMDDAMKAIGPTEIANHYEAHKARFIEKAGAEFSFARFDSRDAAEEALRKLRDPAKAAEVKLEKASRAAGQGEPIPGIGVSPEIAAHLLALAEGEAGDRPIEHEGKFYIFRVEKKRPERQLSLEEAQPRVKADLAALKRKEALESLRGILSTKYAVEILDPDASRKAPPAGEAAPVPADASSGGGSAAPAAPPPAEKKKP